MEELKYPIGHYQKPELFSREIVSSYIEVIENFPNKLREAVIQLSEEQLETPYRPNGWTIRQVINHCADSHMNGFIRLKLALTEDIPTVKPYMQAFWANLVDSKHYPIQSSLLILEGVHLR